MVLPQRILGICPAEQLILRPNNPIQTSVETAQPIDIYRPVRYPIELHERPVAKRPQSEKGGLVHMCETIVHHVQDSLFAAWCTTRWA